MKNSLESKAFQVASLGPCKIKSPLQLSKEMGDRVFNFVREERGPLVQRIGNDWPADENEKLKEQPANF